MDELGEWRKVVIAGGKGFIGNALVEEFESHGYEVVVLSRSVAAHSAGRPGINGRTVHWDGRTVGGWAKELEGACAVINVSGEPIFPFWTEAKKRRILASRLEPTTAICQAIKECARTPAVWINASAVGYYGDTGDATTDERGAAGTDFLAKVCREWEDAQSGCETNTRRVTVRIGLPLGHRGGALPMLARLTKFYIGGSIGNGKQWIPWIAIDDLAALFRWCVESDVNGPVNGVGPGPVTNAELMATMRKVMGRPFAPSVPAAILKLGQVIKLPTDLLLNSSRVVSSMLQSKGFEYRFNDLESALRHELR